MTVLVIRGSWSSFYMGMPFFLSLLNGHVTLICHYSEQFQQTLEAFLFSGSWNTHPALPLLILHFCHGDLKQRRFRHGPSLLSALSHTIHIINVPWHLSLAIPRLERKMDYICGIPQAGVENGGMAAALCCVLIGSRQQVNFQNTDRGR